MRRGILDLGDKQGQESTMDLRPATARTGFSLTEKSQSAKISSPPLPHPMTRKAHLYRVWTELCTQESQARIRNQQLLQDFAGLEAQLALLTSKTDALRRRKRDYEEFLQKRRENLLKHQGASRRQALVSDKPLELLTRPLSTEWDGQLPLEMEYKKEPLLFSLFDIAPTHAPESDGRFEPRFWEFKQTKAPLDHPFYSPSAHPATKHDGPAFPCLWSPHRLQEEEKAWLFPSQGRSHYLSSQPWPDPGKKTPVMGRGLGLPEELLGPVMAQVPGRQTFGSPMASNILQGKDARNHSILSRGGSAEEHHYVAMRKEDGYHLPHDPAGLSCHLRRHRDAPGCMDESQLAQQLMHLGNDSSGASVSSSDEVNSRDWGAERNTKGLPRQQKMKAKQQDADTTMIMNKEFAHTSWERFPGLLAHEEMAIIHGFGKVLREETLPFWKEQGNGELREKGGSRQERSVEEGEATGSLDLGLEKTAEECGPLREGGTLEDEEVSGRAGGLELEQKTQGGSNVGEVGTAGEDNSLGCFDPGQEDLEEDSEGAQGQARLGPGRQEGESMEGERNLQGSNGEGEKSDPEVDGPSSEKTSKPDRSEKSQNGVSGDKEGGLERPDGSQERPCCPNMKEETASISSSSDEVVIGPQIAVTSEAGNIGDCQTPSLQSEGPVATEADSIDEGEEEEEEEDEVEADIEATLAPHFSKTKTSRNHQQGETGQIPNFQELEADSEKENKDGDLHDKDDFYD